MISFSVTALSRRWHDFIQGTAESGRWHDFVQWTAESGRWHDFVQRTAESTNDDGLKGGGERDDRGRIREA